MPENHFSHVEKMVELGSGSRRAIEDYKLSRYACYLIVLNADSSKPVIANGQSYFALQTRRQELSNITGLWLFWTMRKLAETFLAMKNYSEQKCS